MAYPAALGKVIGIEWIRFIQAIQRATGLGQRVQIGSRKRQIYRMCQELVSHLVEQVKKEQLHSPLLATSDMVERHFTVAKQYGWGCSTGEMEWVFRNVVRELGCEMPAFLLRRVHPANGTR